jgi:hypothetical protein
MIDLTGAEGNDPDDLLEQARRSVRHVLEVALNHNALTAGDVLACAEAAVTLGDSMLIERAIATVEARSRAYTPVDVSGPAARDFARAYKILAVYREAATRTPTRTAR